MQKLKLILYVRQIKLNFVNCKCHENIHPLILIFKKSPNVNKKLKK